MQPTPYCHNCGTCCRKGGPLLHTEDMPLIAAGHVPVSMLITLRADEQVYDPVADALVSLDRDVVKIQGTGTQNAPWHCVLHDQTGCSIYAHRPAQCRALFCEDTRTLAQMYGIDRASRADVIGHAPFCTDGWTGLMTAHEERCAVRVMATLSATKRAEALRFDIAFRDLCVARAGIGKDMLLFLLGRPLIPFPISDAINSCICTGSS